MKSKRILALTGAVILIALYVSSIIFALMDSPLGRKSAAGIAVLHDRYTGGALWVCGGTAVF